MQDALITELKDTGEFGSSPNERVYKQVWRTAKEFPIAMVRFARDEPAGRILGELIEHKVTFYVYMQHVWSQDREADIDTVMDDIGEILDKLEVKENNEPIWHRMEIEVVDSTFHDEKSQVVIETLITLNCFRSW